MEQNRIKLAFKGNGRPSNNIAVVQNQRVCFLNGKNTGQLGVTQIEGETKENLRVTSVERTLIDIAVRPMYSGGVSEILTAFKTAKEKEVISVNKLVAMLKEMNFVYPYHQAIGFYMEKSGVYDDFSLSLLKKIGMQYDFYLTYKIQEPEYSKTWRIFYPKGL